MTWFDEEVQKDVIKLSEAFFLIYHVDTNTASALIANN